MKQSYFGTWRKRYLESSHLESLIDIAVEHSDLTTKRLYLKKIKLYVEKKRIKYVFHCYLCTFKIVIYTLNFPNFTCVLIYVTTESKTIKMCRSWMINPGGFSSHTRWVHIY